MSTLSERARDSRNARRRRRRRGVTLVEVLIVVAIMAIIAGGATILVFPAFKKARVQNAKIGAEAVRGAVELYLADATEGGCPQMKDLVEAKKIDSKKTDDPWGKPYKVLCAEGEDIRVLSFGQDGQENTPDDVRDDFKPSDIKRVADL